MPDTNDLKYSWNLNDIFLKILQNLKIQKKNIRFTRENTKISGNFM